MLEVEKSTAAGGDVMAPARVYRRGVNAPTRQAHFRMMLLSAFAGGVLGLSSPGFGQWYLVWFLIVPFLFLAVSSPTPLVAAIRGLIFGSGYNLVALNWFLRLNPPYWVGFDDPSARFVLSLVVWFSLSVLQAFSYCLLAAVVRALPISGGLFRLRSRRFTMPALLTIPFIWTLTSHILFNQTDFLLMPMTVLEYSQYKQLWLIQMASLVGGVGIEALIVAVNAAIAVVIATVGGFPPLSKLSAPSRKDAWAQFVAVMAIVLSAAIFGFTQLQNRPPSAQANLSIVQPGHSARTNQVKRTLRLHEIWPEFKSAIERSRKGIVIFCETAFPLSSLTNQELVDQLNNIARAKNTDIVLGSAQMADLNQMYNTAVSVPARSSIPWSVYKKRYLIPFGEFEPFILRTMPLELRQALHLPEVPKFIPGREGTPLKLSQGGAVPIICGENVYSLLCADGVSPNTNLIVNLSNLTWFENSMLGELNDAFCVMRAVENRRAFAYASDSGPSVIIDPYGEIQARSAWSSNTLLTAPVSLRSDVTFFTEMCHQITPFLL
ncbi:MAG TPA: apolipoprotein N-acyltransferase [Candidatus Obscuribacterales bacterium]